MGILIQIFTFLIETFGGLFYWAVLLRFLLQVARADFYNPISQALVRVTNPLLKPLRRIIPGVMGLDVAALVLALLIKIVMLTVILLMTHGALLNPLQLLLLSLLHVVVTIANIYFLAMIASIIVSWVAQGSYNPAVTLITQIAEPVMAPFRRLIPPMGGLDISPMIAFAALYIVQILLSATARAVGVGTRQVMGLLLLGY